MHCSNCEVEIDTIGSPLVMPLCPSCRWLLNSARHPHPSWDRELRELARCGFTNRRWQMRFNRRELT